MVESVRCMIFKNQFRLYKYQFCISFFNLLSNLFMIYISKKKKVFRFPKFPKVFHILHYKKYWWKYVIYIHNTKDLFNFFFSFQLIHSFYDKQNSYSVVFTTFFLKVHIYINSGGNKRKEKKFYPRIYEIKIFK